MHLSRLFVYASDHLRSQRASDLREISEDAERHLAYAATKQELQNKVLITSIFLHTSDFISMSGISDDHKMVLR